MTAADKSPPAIRVARTKLVAELTFHKQTLARGLCTPYGVQRAEADIERLEAAIAKADRALSRREEG